MLTQTAEKMIGQPIQINSTIDQVILDGDSHRYRVVLPGGILQEFYEEDVTRQSLTFGELRESNVTRCEEVFHKLDDWSPTDWATAMAGECGEACNQIKKLRRLDGADAAQDTQEERHWLKVEIARELADLIIYADLLAARLDIDLAEVIKVKFNEVSEKRKSTVFL